MARATVLKRFELSPEAAAELEVEAQEGRTSQTAIVQAWLDENLATRLARQSGRTPASPDVQTDSTRFPPPVVNAGLDESLSPTREADPSIDPVIVAERRRGFNNQKQAGVKPKQMLNEAKAESVGDTVRRTLPIDTVEKYPASEPRTYCPRHRPKPCAADCEYRVNIG